MILGDTTVVGAGAVGGFAGARLAAAGIDVLLIDSDVDHVQAIRDNGIRIRGQCDVDTFPHVVTWEEADGRLETVLLAVKARETADALEMIKPKLAADGCVVSLQNGFEEEKIARAVGAARTVGACLTFGGHRAGPGEIVFAGTGSFWIGELDGARSERVRALADLLEHVHPVAITDRILGFVWGKTALEAFYFATAIADADVREVLTDATMLPTLEVLVREVGLVARAVGSPCESIDGFAADAFIDGDRGRVEASWEAQGRYWSSHTSQRTGIWRDLVLDQRRTEVDAVLGPVVDVAAALDVPTPFLARLVDLVHNIEVGLRPAGLDALAALAA